MASPDATVRDPRVVIIRACFGGLSAARSPFTKAFPPTKKSELS